MSALTFLIIWLVAWTEGIPPSTDFRRMDDSEARFSNLQDFAQLRYYRGTNVRSLTISGSTVQELRRNDLYKFMNISEFKFSSNHVNITEDALRYLTNLIRLDMENNSLTSLPAKMFSSNKKLASLNLNYNNFSSLGAGFLEPLSDLRKLYLRNNSIGSLDPGVFRDNKKLRILDISHNDITIIRRGVFTLSDVADSHINLAFNSISEIEGGAFAYCSQVTKLLLEHNKMASLGEDVLRGLTSLRVLDVSYNALEALEPSVFASMAQLKTLRAEHNRIATFGGELVAWARTSLVIVSLHDNPLRCVCGPLAQAYHQSATLGPALDLTCDDGRSWDVLQTLSCPQANRARPEGPHKAHPPGSERGASGVNYSTKSAASSTPSSTTPARSVSTSPIPAKPRTKAPSNNSTSSSQSSVTIYTVVVLMCVAGGTLILYAFIKTLMVIFKRRPITAGESNSYPNLAYNGL